MVGLASTFIANVEQTFYLIPLLLFLKIKKRSSYTIDLLNFNQF